MSPKRIVLRFMAETSEKPIIYNLIKNYDLIVNILKAQINPRKEGTMILEIEGEPEQYTRGMEYLRSIGITIQPLSQEVHHNNDICVHCGACTNLCPSGALFLERPDMTVSFDDDKCVICLLCVKACPYKAMEVSF